MNNNYIEVLKEIFGDSDILNMDQVKRLIIETNSYFATLENTLQNGDAKAREEAVAAALEVKAYLDSKSNLPTKFSGLDALTEEERDMVSEMQNGLQLVKRGKSSPKIKKLKPIKMS